MEQPQQEQKRDCTSRAGKPTLMMYIHRLNKNNSSAITVKTIFG